MPNEDSVLIDPIFSKKLRECEVVAVSEEDLTTKIDALYESLAKKKALYYQGKAIGSSLETFVASEDFPHLIAQFEVCFEKLYQFCDAQSITIPSQQNARSGSTLLLTFLNKLKTDYFSDRRALLYGPGKKYIEILSVFINDPHIDLNFRILQIINLLSDEGLSQSCAEGCFTRLQYASDSFKNYANFELPFLYKKYLESLVDEVIHRPILIEAGEETTITQKIADYMNIDPVGFEIHGRNFILKRFKENFDLRLLELVADEYVNTIENFFAQHPEQNSVLDSYFRYLLKDFSEEATMTNFVSYLSEVMYRAFPTNADYMERIRFLEETALQPLGQDPEFSLDEILLEETGLLKNAQCLGITISERLLNQGWMTLNWSEIYRKNRFFRRRNRSWQSARPPIEPFTDAYRLFYCNLPLSWIKVDAQRQKIINLLEQVQGVQKIQSIHSDQIALLNSLIQTPQDLAVFFNYLAPSQLESGLQWIKSTPEFICHVLGYYKNEASIDLLEPLLFVITQLNTQERKEFFLATFEQQLSIKKLLQERINRLSSDGSSRMSASCTALIKKVCSLGVASLSNFKFYRSVDFFGSKPYLTEINFSSTKLDFSIFFEDVFRCSFSYAKMYNLGFYGGVFATDLSFADIKNTLFDKTVEDCNFERAELFKVDFNLVVMSDFLASNLEWIEFKKNINQCNFQRAKIANTYFLKRVSGINFNNSELKVIVFSGKVITSFFKFAHFDSVEFHDLVVNNSFISAYLSWVKFFNELSDSRFNAATLNEVAFIKKIDRSFFINTHLKKVTFVEEIRESIFDHALCVEANFKKKIVTANFMRANLIEIKFEGELNDCDFSFSILNQINFIAEIIKTRFNTADLHLVSFFSHMQNCEFISATIHTSSFNGKELNNINFINAHLIQVKFIDSYLINNYFIKTSLINTIFENSFLEEVTFNKANLEGAIFRKTQFKIKVTFTESNLKNAEFSECDLSLVSFFDSNLEHLELKNSIVTPQQLFDTFYSAGLRDFSEVYFSENVISKNDFLLLYKNKSLKEAILSESIFKGLVKLGYRNFSKTDLTKLKIPELIHFYHNIDYSFSGTKLPEIFLAPRPGVMHARNGRERSISLSECLSKQQRNKREENQCIITWSDVDPFNKNTEDKRNFEKIIIDSDAFIKTLFSTSDIKKSKLLELIDVTDVKGFAAESLVKLRTVQKAKQYFYRMGDLSGALSQGLLYENILMDFLHEDYSDVAINVLLITGSGLSSSFAEGILKYSEKLKISGKVFLNQYFKLSTPFIRRGLSTSYMVYDLVTQVSAVVKGNKDAFANVVGDGLFISTDVLETGIEVLELSGMSLEMAALVTPAGQILGALILVGTQTYHAVRAVAKIKALISLTPWQTFAAGLDAFLGINFSNNIQEQLELNQAYAIYSQNINNFLEKNPAIKYYIVPSIDFIVDRIFNVCWREFTVTYNVRCGPKITKHIDLVPESTLYLKQESQSGTLIAQFNPLKNNFNPEQIFCNPYKVSLNNETLLCNSALVIANPWASESQTHTLLALGIGHDIAYGFAENVNTFIINDGHKAYIGGKHDDRFIINASTLEGWLDGNSGSDLLDLRLYGLEGRGALTIDLLNEKLKHVTKTLKIRNFERILGRKKQKDWLLVTNTTEFVDLQGGTELYFDEIKIGANIYNATLEIMVRACTSVTNQALNGNFLYTFPSAEKSSIDNGIITEYSSLIFPNQVTTANHTFLFDYHLKDLSSVTINRGINNFNFFFDSGSNFSNYSVKLTNFPIQAHYFFKSDTQLKIGLKGNLYAFLTSELAVQALIEIYTLVARRLGITLFLHQSVSNEAIIIGHTNHQVLKNDLSASKTHLVANGGENIYVITIEDNHTFPIPDVIIYQQATDQMQHILDLRPLNAIITEGILENPRINVSVTKVEEDLHLSLLFTRQQADIEPLLALSTIINIVLKQGIDWYPQLKVLFNRVPLEFSEVQSEQWQLKPLPLSFEASRKNIILTKDDIEAGNQIILHRPTDQHVFLRNGSDLWLTTLFISKSYLNENYTILFKDFYLHAKMQSLNLFFADTKLLLSDYASDIANAEDLQAKLTSLELSAWKEVAKQRSAESKEPQEVPAIQTRLLADTLSHNTGHFSSNVRSSAPSLHHSWLSRLKKSIEEPLWRLWSTGQRLTGFYWREAVFYRKKVQNVVSYATGSGKCWVPLIDLTVVNAPKIHSQQNTRVIGHEQHSTDFPLPANDCLSLNTGILQLLDLAIRKYTVKPDVTAKRMVKKRAKKTHNSASFFNQRCEASNDSIQNKKLSPVSGMKLFYSELLQ